MTTYFMEPAGGPTQDTRSAPSRPASRPSSPRPSPLRPSPSGSEVVCEDGTCVLQPRGLRPALFPPGASTTVVMPGSSRIGVVSPAEEEEGQEEVLFTKRLRHVSIVEPVDASKGRKPRQENTYLNFPNAAQGKGGRSTLASEFFITDGESRNTYKASVTPHEVSARDPFAPLRPRTPTLPRQLCAIL